MGEPGIAHVRPAQVELDEPAELAQVNQSRIADSGSGAGSVCRQLHSSRAQMGEPRVADAGLVEGRGNTSSVVSPSRADSPASPIRVRASERSRSPFNPDSCAAPASPIFVDERSNSVRRGSPARWARPASLIPVWERFRIVSA